MPRRTALDAAGIHCCPVSIRNAAAAARPHLADLQWLIYDGGASTGIRTGIWRVHMTDPTGPLKGLRVFDLTRVLAGPTCAQMLADLGADVVKIERPGAGDDTRGFAPPYMEGTKESAYFVGVNRNKQSVTLDIGQAAGQEIALKLIAQ